MVQLALLQPPQSYQCCCSGSYLLDIVSFIFTTQYRYPCLYQAMYSKMVSLLSCLSRDSSVRVLNLQPFEVKVGRWQLCFRYMRMRYRHGYSVCLTYINNATDLLLGLAWRNDVVDVTRIENICASSRTRMRIRYKIRSLSEAAKCHIQSVHSSLQVEHFPSLLLSISRLLDAREGLLRDVCEWEAW